MILLCSGIAVADSPDPNEYVSLWVSGTNLAYHNTNLSVYGPGYRRNLNYDYKIDFEIGPAFSWRTWTEADNPDDTQSNFAIGAYTAIHFTDLITIANPLAEDIEWMPDTLLGEPFIAIEGLWDTKAKGAAVSPLVGCRAMDAFAVYYKFPSIHGEDASEQKKFGISVKFEF